MIQNLLNIPSRATEKNVSGVINDAKGKGSLNEKEGLFKQLFESLQNPKENEESENKGSLDNGDLSKEADSDAENSKMGENLNQTNVTDTENSDKAKSASTAEGTKTDSSQKVNQGQENSTKNQAVTESNVNQVQNSRTESGSVNSAITNGSGNPGTELTKAEIKGSQSAAPVLNSQPVQGGKSEEGVSDRSLHMANQAQNSQTESGSVNSTLINGSGNPGAESTKAENRGSQSAGPAVNGQPAQGDKSEEGVSDRSLHMANQAQNSQTESGFVNSTLINGSGNPGAEPKIAENRGSQSAAPAINGQRIQEGTSVSVDGTTINEVIGQQSHMEKTEQILEKEASNISSILPQDNLGLGSGNGNNAQDGSINGKGTDIHAQNVKDIPVTDQAAKIQFKEAATLDSDSQSLETSKLAGGGNGVRIENGGAGSEILSGRTVTSQSHGAVLTSGTEGPTPQAAKFVQKAQAFAAENGQVNERNAAPVATLIREELKTVDVNKPEVFGAFSGIKKSVIQKNQDQNIRSRLDLDKISMRADIDKRAPILGLENQQFISNNQQAFKWDWAAGAQGSSSKNMDDPVSFNNLKPESTFMKDVEAVDQKSTNYINLTSITISNISVKRNVLPGLTQAVLNSGTGKSSPESWNKHSFVLDDGSKIQLAARKLEGVIQLKIGSATPELNRLLQQHQNEIIEHLKKETELEVDLQFDNPKEESGFESFDDRNFATNSTAKEGINSGKSGPVGSQKYATGRTIRTFGYNNMEWTA